MVITPHMLVGAAAGSRQRSLRSAARAGFHSHFLLDRIPHGDYSPSTSEGNVLVAAELLVVGVALWGLGANRKAVVGALSGIAPDLICLFARRHRRGPWQHFLDRHEDNHTGWFLPAAGAANILVQAAVSIAAVVAYRDDS